MGRVTEAGRADPGQRRLARQSSRERSASRGVGLVVTAAAVLLFMAVVGGYQLVYFNSVFPGVRVGDVNLGGMQKDRALAELRPLYEERASRPLLLRGPDAQRQVSVADLGATFDAASAVDAAYRVGRTGSWGERLTAQVAALARGYSVETPGIGTDRTKLQGYITRLAQEIDRPVKDAQLVIGDDLSVQISPAVVGRKLDVVGAAAAVEKAATGGTAAIDLPVAETRPKRVERDLEEAQGKVSRMLAGPVAVEFEGRRWALSPKEIAGLISVEPKEGASAPTVSLQDTSLRSLVDRIAGEVDQPKKDARLDWNGGKLKVVTPGQDGRKIDRAKALSLLTEAISSDRRTVSLPGEVDRAIGGSIDPSTLGIKERIEFGQTTIAGVPEKVHNIKLAASRLNGVVVRPGDTFSFNKELGPTTLKSGYQIGFGISVNNGEMQTVPSVAGGICQVATTLLHSLFWAGYQIEERYPHLYWIASYGQPPRGMVGLDATVDDPMLDLKFVNNTGNYLLIQSKTEDNILEFDLYGTKPNWKVEVEGPVISNVVKADPKTVQQEEPTWDVGRELWVERATDGMDVSIIRRVVQGDDVRTLRLKSRYQPSRNVLMVGTKKPEPTPQAPSATPTASSQQRTATPAPTPAPAGSPVAPASAASPVAR